jgi:hypothetical protein
MDITFKATPLGLNHFVTTLFILVAIGGYFIGLNEAVLVIAGVMAIIRMFHDEVSILLYPDKFIIRYSNYFGKLLATDLIYYSDRKNLLDGQIF